MLGGNHVMDQCHIQGRRVNIQYTINYLDYTIYSNTPLNKMHYMHIHSKLYMFITQKPHSVNWGRLVVSTNNINDNTNGKCTQKIIAAKTFDPVSKLQIKCYFCVLCSVLGSVIKVHFLIFKQGSQHHSKSQPFITPNNVFSKCKSTGLSSNLYQTSGRNQLKSSIVMKKK